jgi:hypothetical protein
MCGHIHRNHLAFVESVKNRIRLATLSDHKNDVASYLRYLRFLQNNLRIITSTGSDAKAHNDLIPHIFMQLRFTTIPIFQQKVLEWQRSYIENKLPLTPTQLVMLADEESQILRHSNQWVDPHYLRALIGPLLNLLAGINSTVMITLHGFMTRLRTCLKQEPIGTEFGATAGNVAETANEFARIRTPRIEMTSIQLPRTVHPHSTMIAMSINLRISVSLMVCAPGRGHHIRRDLRLRCTVGAEVFRFFHPLSLVLVPNFRSLTQLMLSSMKSDHSSSSTHISCFLAACQVFMF